MSIVLTGTLIPAGDFPAVDVANVSNAASQTFVSEAVSGGVGAIPDATAATKGLATTAQISKLDALPADAQSAQQVSDAAAGIAASAVSGIPDATAALKGLATATQISKLDGLPADAQSASQVSSTAGSAASAAVSAIPDATAIAKGLATPALVTDVASSSKQLIIRPSSFELEDHFGARLKAQWRAEKRYASTTGSNVTAITDRVSRLASRALSNTTPAQQPTWLASDPAFGGRSSINFGATRAHAKKLYTTDANTSLASPYARFIIFRINQPYTGSGWVMASGDELDTSRIYIADTSGGSVAFSNPTAWTAVRIDTASPLAYCLIINPYEPNNFRSNALLIRSDGKFTHPDDLVAGANVASGVASGPMLLGNRSIASSNGHNISVSDCGQIEGLLDQTDYSAFFRYTHEHFNFTYPSREITYDGNSLMASYRSHQAAALSINSGSYNVAMSGDTLDDVISGVISDTRRGSCLVGTCRRAYVCTEITNTLSSGTETFESVSARIVALIQLVRGLGFDDIVFSTCMARVSMTAPMVIVKDQVNTWLTENWQSLGIDKLVNLHTLTPIDGQSCPAELMDPANTTYFLDGTHPTTLGYNSFFYPQFLNRLVELGY